MNTKKKSGGTLLFLRDAGVYFFAPAALGLVSFRYIPDKADFLQQAATLSTIAATLLGFIIAAVAVIVAIDNQTLIRNLKKYGYYFSLIRSMMFSGLFMLLTTIVAFAVGFFPEDWQRHGMAASIFITTIAFSCFVIASRRLWMVMVVLARNSGD